MKNTLITLALAFAVATPALADNYDATKALSCIVFIQKHADTTDKPNYQIMCDGHQMLKQEIGDYSQLGDASYLKAALRTTLKSTMGADSSVTCTEADNEYVWYQNCYR